MRITRLLLPGILFLLLANSTQAQSGYNGWYEKAERDNLKRQQEKERLGQVKSQRLEAGKAAEKKQERQRDSLAEVAKRNVTAPPQKAKNSAPMSQAEMDAWTQQQANYAKKWEPIDKTRKIGVDAINNKDIRILGALIESDDYRNIPLSDQVKFRKAYLSLLMALTKDSVEYFKDVRKYSSIYEEYGCAGKQSFISRDINSDDYVGLRLMVLTGHYGAAIECLKASLYYGATSFIWTTNDEYRFPKDRYQKVQDKAKEAYHFTNYMAGRCFQVLNMPDSAARYLKIGGDFSVEWNRLAAYQNSAGWSGNQPMLSVNELREISGQMRKGE